MSITTLFELDSFAAAMPLVFAVVLLIILIISFRSRAVVFCQYLEAMTGIRLKPSDVRRVFRQSGREGVREMFLDLIIREDLKEGPIDPEETLSRKRSVEQNAAV
jgi:hypothetical protein